MLPIKAIFINYEKVPKENGTFYQITFPKEKFILVYHDTMSIEINTIINIYLMLQAEDLNSDGLEEMA